MSQASNLELFHAAPETAKTVAAWLAYFKTERRASAHTLDDVPRQGEAII